MLFRDLKIPKTCLSNKKSLTGSLQRYINQSKPRLNYFYQHKFQGFPFALQHLGSEMCYWISLRNFTGIFSLLISNSKVSRSPWVKDLGLKPRSFLAFSLLAI